jgi:uncharacterized circularly permuted ATP-grasp superfamily protein/uncharacterized alpha-E superfamily protein
MQPSLLPDDPLPSPAELLRLAARPGSDGHFNELIADKAAARLRPAWQAFAQAAGTTAWARMADKRADVLRRVRDDGATYNVYADGNRSSHEWPLELLPFIIEAQDWKAIEQGVQQRTRLLDRVLADLYGEQTLLRDGLLPPSLVLAHPQYLRPAHGIRPRGGVFLHMAAFDLARGPQGNWWVLAQRLQAPSGLGYLIENRLIIRHQFPQAFAALHVQRLGASLKGMIDGLLRLSELGTASRVALLTPGPLNETYFEQVFLARYLGIPLVEADDLTVRGERLYLKAMHGLEAVHVLLRRVDDEWLDPLELRADSELGVPGLLQVVRAGHLVLANAPGAGVLESPGLAAFWPALAQRMLGEALLLPASTSWWCGEEAVWKAQRPQLPGFVVAPTFPDGRGSAAVIAALQDAAARERLAEAIDTDPAAYTLQARVLPSETPVWAEGTLQPRSAIVRVVVFTDGRGGWQVLPGGFTRVAAQYGPSSDPWLSMQRGSASLDTWVITEGKVDTTSLLPKPLTVSELRERPFAVTSRAAENLFWMGRYAERAENSVRLAQIALEALPSAAPVVREMLGRLATDQGLVPAEYALTAGALTAVGLRRAIQDALRQPDGADSGVAFNLRALHGCAHARRERMTAEHWRMIEQAQAHFCAQAQRPGSDLLQVLARAATDLSAITGAQTDRMSRDNGWRLLSVGRQIERLDSLADTLATAFDTGAHDTDEGFGLVLQLFESVITYRERFQARREVLPLLALLVFDTDNPRSLAWVARTMRDRLRKLARHDPAWADEVLARAPDPLQWSLQALGTPDAAGRHHELIAALGDCIAGARELSDAIGRKLFAHVEPASRTVWQ